MTTQTAEKIYREVRALRRETKSLKNLVLLLLRDPEGDYRDLFVKRVLKKSFSKPVFVFTGKTDFLKQLSS